MYSSFVLPAGVMSNLFVLNVSVLANLDKQITALTNMYK
jgi:hypothetical protein